LFQKNDLELFDLEKDPEEMTNLAATKGENFDLVMKMSAS
jgi:hypothetical protein